MFCVAPDQGNLTVLLASKEAASPSHLFRSVQLGGGEGEVSKKLSSFFLTHSLGKGSKIKLIILAEFSAKGGGVPPIREND